MEIIKFDSKNLKIIIKKIKEGKVLAFPTDTVYGLIRDATNKKAVKRLFRIKKRRSKNPIPLFVKDIEMAKKIVRINRFQEDFLKTIWPGKATIVLKRKKTKIKLYGIDKKTIALRIPNFRAINLLLKKMNIPLAESSANISGKSASSNIKEVLKQFGYSYSHRRIRISRAKGERALSACPDLVVDAGNLPKNKPSTVLDLTIFPPKILRT